MSVILPGLVQTGTVQSKTKSLRSSLVFRLRWTGLFGSLPQTGTVRNVENIGIRSLATPNSFLGWDD